MQTKFSCHKMSQNSTVLAVSYSSDCSHSINERFHVLEPFKAAKYFHYSMLCFLQLWYINCYLHFTNQKNKIKVCLLRIRTPKSYRVYLHNKILATPKYPPNKPNFLPNIFSFIKIAFPKPDDSN